MAHNTLPISHNSRTKTQDQWISTNDSPCHLWPLSTGRGDFSLMSTPPRLTSGTSRAQDTSYLEVMQKAVDNLGPTPFATPIRWVMEELFSYKKSTKSSLRFLKTNEVCSRPRKGVSEPNLTHVTLVSTPLIPCDDCAEQ